MKKWIIAVVLGVAFVGGCDKDPAAPTVRAVMPDLSLPPQGYVKQGLPPIDHPWSANDMETALPVLKKIAAINGQGLPRYLSPTSGSVYARIISDENLHDLEDTTKPLGDRFPDTIKFLEVSSNLLKTYLAAFTKSQVAPDDLIELLACNLRICVLMLNEVDELMPTITRSDPKYHARMEGLATMKNGLTEVASGSLLSLTERTSYPIPTRRRLIVHLRKSLPTIVPHLADDKQAAVMKQLDGLVADPTLADLQPGLGSLRDEVITAVATAKAAKKG